MNVTTYQPTHKRPVVPIPPPFEGDPQNRARCIETEFTLCVRARCPRHAPMLYTGRARHRA